MKLTKNNVSSEYGKSFYWISYPANSSKGTLIFTHGLTADHSTFDKQIDFFCNDYTIITWDVPMHGESVPYSTFSYSNAAAELNNILIKEQIDEAIHIGMSMGGYVVQSFIEKYPQKVKGFVALGTTPFGLKYYSKSDMWWLKRVKLMFGWLTDKMIRSSIVKTCSSEYGKQVVEKILMSKTKKELLDQLDIAYRVFTEENHDISITCPILLTVGESDNLGKVQGYNDRWSKDTGFSLVKIPKAGHVLNCDNPDYTNIVINNFIEENIFEK